MTRRVAIIGAGPSGLAQLRAFQAAKAQGADIPDIVCYEKQSDWGGLWNYTWRTGVDEHGNPCHGSMYRYLWSNAPKEGLEFADYSFEEHFGKPIASYPPRAVLLDYLQGHAKQAGVLRSMVRFNHHVRDVRYNDASDQFEITARDGTTDTESCEHYDHVIVATGHFSTPHVPYYTGFESFNGRILHAHDFRDARESAGKDILILGTSFSAEDIGSQCWKYGAKSITVAHRKAPMGYDWPENWREVPALEHVDEKTAYFADGTSKAVDTIILCTGYKHYFPFLPDDLRLKTANRLAVSELYKGVVYHPNPKLFYLGMQNQWYSFNMFSAQAWWVRDCIMGSITLPDADTMRQDPVRRQAEEDALIEPYAGTVYQSRYIAELTAETDYPSYDMQASNRAFHEWMQHKKANIMAFRNHGYTSPMTGKLAPAHHTLWKDALDDSLESYLRG